MVGRFGEESFGFGGVVEGSFFDFRLGFYGRSKRFIVVGLDFIFLLVFVILGFFSFL